MLNVQMNCTREFLTEHTTDLSDQTLHLEKRLFLLVGTSNILKKPSLFNFFVIFIYLTHVLSNEFDYRASLILKWIGPELKNYMNRSYLWASCSSIWFDLNLFQIFSKSLVFGMQMDIMSFELFWI